ncbi:DUF3231 family protein [Paenibacillus chartarius]|uniref:DUF3231 family protein n=1 Tax=Paenibacillus chartarius TaxID=747481 RepID=A0ABV6DJR1_9BACL
MIEQEIKRSEQVAQQQQQEPQNKSVPTNISNLWQAYTGNSINVVFNQYSLQFLDDPKIRQLCQLTLQYAQYNVDKLEEIFHDLDFPVPIGFTDADVNLKAPRLFSDHFWLYFLNEMSVNGMIGYALSIGISVSEMVRQFNKEAMNQAIELYEKSLNLMQEFEVFDNFPQISIPGIPEFAHQQSYLLSWFRGPSRTLDVLEISSIYANLKKTILHKALAIAFSQVANLKEVREVMLENVKTTQNNIEEFMNVLHNDFLPSPRLWDSEITDSKIPPFSDRMMLTFISTLISLSLSNYGSGMSVSTRMDLAPIYSAAMARKGKLGYEVSRVLIDNGWLQQPPLAPDRKMLAKS